MTIRTLRLLSVLIALLLSDALLAQRAVFVVRHAEKEGEGSEKGVPLSKAGVARAERLATLLKDAGVNAIYSTDTVRTRATAEPLARARKLPIKIYDPRDAKATMAADPLAASLKADEKDGVVLVVGHSNTVPDVLAAYGNNAPVRIGPDDYGDLFLLVPQASGAPVLLRLKF
ncbi:MAG: SixA phosphatase family protein [Thermoanaerobaculia bacterium]